MSEQERTSDVRPAGVRLSTVAQALADAGLLLEPLLADAVLHGVSDDSRRIAPGDLHCAWHGATVDGHTFVAAAQDAGAAAALVERQVRGVGIPQLIVRDGRRAAAIAASMVYGDPQSLLRLVGVTGTNGKTTTVWIVRHLLSAVEPTASLGTLGAILEDGSTLPDSDDLTTPGPVELARTLHRLVERGVRAVAMEASSHALHQGRVQAVRYDACVFTTFSRDHLDYHGTLEAYLQAKQGLLDLLRPGGVAVINADDPAWAGIAERAPRFLTFGIAQPAALTAEDIDLGANGSEATFAYRGGRRRLHLPLPGAFNVQNALAAAGAALALGMEFDDVVSVLTRVPQVPGRLERIADRPCPVLRDYAHTPDALERALAALRPLARERLIVVFGAGGERDRGKRPLMGAAAERGADVVIVTSDNPRGEDPDSIIDEIVAGMSQGGYTRIADRRAAIAHALTLGQPGDIILLAGKGHETYQMLGRRKLPFDERVVVRDLLAASEVAP